MIDSHRNEQGTGRTDEQTDDPFRYPTHHVIAILDTPQQADAAVQALTSGGFLDSEVTIGCGTATADALSASTGRRGLARLGMRIAESIGIANDEMQFKAEYEQALRDNRFVILVNAPSEDRKHLATRILHEHEGRAVRYYGRFTIESPLPRRAD